MAISVIGRRPPLLTRILATAQSGVIPRDLLEGIRRALKESPSECARPVGRGNTIRVNDLRFSVAAWSGKAAM
jgi:hypothetical protein